MSNEKSQTCLSCGKEYQRIGSHWSSGNCPYPKLTKEQEQILTGFMMGDGCVSNGHGRHHPRVVTSMVTPEYLEWIDNKFPQYGTGVTAKCMENSPGNYQQAYNWQTRTSPKFNKWLKWYDSGSKVFPEDIVMTPLVLKNWYVTDGSYNTSGNHNGIRIYANNEFNNSDKLQSYFTKVGLPEPKIHKNRRGEGWNELVLYWGKKDTVKIFDYMGTPLPGFKYKWDKS